MKNRLLGPGLLIRPYFQTVDANIWLVLAFSGFAWAPLLTPAYFFEAHDAKHSVFFLVEFDQTFRDGFFWPRWTPDFSFGYGYPLFNLYAPLAFYAAELWHLLGLRFTTAIKVMYILATIGAGLSMYGFGRALFGRRAGLLAAVVFMYTPFHLVEIFVRSAYAEFVALAIIPLLFWAFTALVTRPNSRRLALAGLTYGLLALTHHSSFFTFTPLLMVYVLYLIGDRAKFDLKSLWSRAWPAAGAGALGLSLAAIYLLPLVTEMRFVKIEQWTSGSYNYLDHFVYFSQFFSPDWGYGYAGPGPDDDFSYQLGLIPITVSLFALVSLGARRFPRRRTALFFGAATIVTIFLMSPLAAPVWRLVPIAALVQFPWRLLSVTTFTMAVVAGSVLASGGERSPLTGPQTPAPLYLLLGVVVLASFPYTLPVYTEIPEWAETPLAVVNWDRASIADRVGMVSVTQEQPQTSPLEPEYLADGYPTTVAALIAGRGSIETLHHGGASDKIRVLASEPVTVQFYTYDYPGWQVSLNGRPLAHRPEPPLGLITVEAPPGEHILHLRMGGTPARTAGTILSGLALLLITLFLIFWPRLDRSPHFDN